MQKLHSKIFSVMKEIIGRSKHKTKPFPSRATIDKEEMFNRKEKHYTKI